ncbi:MAG: prolyl oligopeptidase family serine peptidase [Nocardioidaceae bacterium]
MTSTSQDQPTVAPYGEWVSPISAADLATSTHRVEGARYVDDQIWWLELRPGESGRSAIRTSGPDGEPVDILPGPWNVRTRVHEYGGGAWAVDTARAAGAPRLVFAEFTDQRLYRLDAGSQAPVALTPPGSGFRFADLQIHGSAVVCVREAHHDDTGHNLTRDVCMVPLDGSAAADPARMTSVVSGSHFLAYPRVSPDGSRLAWVAWDHPQMPWDGTELRVGDLIGDYRVDEWKVVAGGTTESVLQPEWDDDGCLLFASDRTGWWNLYRRRLETSSARVSAELEPLCPAAAEFAGPLWMLGTTFYLPLGSDRLLTVPTVGAATLGVLDAGSGEQQRLDSPLSAVMLCDRRDDGDRALTLGAGERQPAGLYEVDLATGKTRVVRLGVDTVPDDAFLPRCEERTFTGTRDVHAIVYPPRNAHFVAPEGELPPYVVAVHGGPTGHAMPVLNLATAFLTSRGVGVVEVNYGGSTGYGREYRERLRGQWGIVDVEDAVTVVRGLADAGLADGDRVAITGASAGGWTVLAALTSSDVFACGASYFGVAELTEFAAHTHDFESRYLDGLIGPLPEAADLYEKRAPVNNVDGLSCPVLLLQGLADPIVPPAQAECFRDAMVAAHIPHAYLAFEGESHGFRMAESVVASKEAELSFYGQCMGFTPPGVPVLSLSE